MIRRRRNIRGFTLFELVLVMLIICIVLAMAAPSLRGWSRGSDLRDAGTQFLALARFARAQAIASSAVHRLYVDPNDGRYWVMTQDGDNFVTSPTSFGRVFMVPDNCRIVMTDEQQQPLEYVEFFPNGRARQAHVRIESSAVNDFVDIDSPSPVEGFRILPQQSAQR